MRIIYLLLLSLFFASCSSYNHLKIDVLTPAKYSIPPEIKSVVLVDNSEAFRSSKIHEIEIMGEKHYVDSIWNDDFASTAIEVLKEDLIFRNFFDTVYVHKEKLPSNVYNLKTGLPLSYVNTLCEKYNAEAVISLEDYLYRSKLKLFRGVEGEIYGDLDIYGSVMWRFSSSVSQKVLFQEIQSDTIYWQEVGSNIRQVTSRLPRYSEAIMDLSTYMGGKSANYYAPTWKQESRGFYSSAKYEFVMAEDFVRKDNWGEAIKLWKSVYDKGKTKEKAWAAYNLSLASEILGDIDSAVVWIMRCTDLLKNYPSHKATIEKARLAQYSYKLNLRKKVIEKLKQQVGGI